MVRLGGFIIGIMSNIIPMSNIISRRKTFKIKEVCEIEYLCVT